MKRLLVVLVVMAALCSCTSEIENKIAQEEKVSGNYDGIKTNGINQNWETTRQVNLGISVKDCFDGKYTSAITIHTQDPITSAPLVGGTATKYSSFNTTFSVPSDSKGVFVKQVTPDNKVYTKYVTLKPGLDVHSELVAFNNTINKNICMAKCHQTPSPVICDQVYTFAFEDNWPRYGDFDMNDAVVQINRTTRVLDKANKVTEFTIEGSVRAVGAAKTLNLYLRLPELDRPITNVSGGVYDPESNSVHICTLNDVMGITSKEMANVWPQKDTIQRYNFVVTCTFNNHARQDALDIAFLDLYLVTSNNLGNKRTEIHLPKFRPTALANKWQVGTASSLSKTKPYLSKDGLCFAMMVPIDFAYPRELEPLNEVYYHFKDWVVSNGAAYGTWYDTTNVNLVDKSKLFIK